MPENEETTLKQTLDHLLAIVARRRWWVIVTTALVVLGTLAFLSRLPNRYSSEAILLVVQQQIPQRYVLPTTTTDIREALQATTEEVLSRTKLLAIVDEFGLYAKERKSLSPEGLLDLIRRDIEIQPVEGQFVNSFKISFIANNALVAQAVTDRLTSLFIEQNLETREHQATTTTNFLHEQLQAAKTKLAAAEEEVRDFKLQHLGELPEQEQGNVAILNGLQTQLQNTMASLSRAQEQGQYLESLNRYRTLAVESELAHLESEKVALLERYEPAYPAVIRINKKIEQTRALIKMMQTPSGEVDSSEPAQAIPLEDHDMDVSQLRSQLDANRLEIQDLSNDQRQLRASLEQYQNRLNQTPVREQQLAGILRNYELLKQDYTDLLNKEIQSQLAGDLEKRQEGQQYRLIDRPSLPTVPTSPNRVKIGAGAAVAGIALGLMLAFLVEARDRSFHTEDDLSECVGLPLVMGIPLLLTAEEEFLRSRVRVFEFALGSGLTLVVLAAELYEFYLYRHV